MNVLSIFDGMSGAQLALNKLGVEVNKYYASEIDKFAIAVTQHNFPDTVQLGDVTKIEADTLPKIDLLIGGSPCQGFSFAGKQLNFKDERSKLFFEFVRLLKELKPEYFLLENVRMKQEYQDVITSFLGVEPILINSSLLSAQNRKRLYWTNIKNVAQPEDKGLVIKDIIDKAASEKAVKNTPRNRRHYKEIEDKSLCLTATMYKGAGNNGMSLIPTTDYIIHNDGEMDDDDVKIGALRGRYLEDGKRKDKKGKSVAGKTTQRLEIRSDDKSNCLTTVQKDNLVIQNLKKECNHVANATDIKGYDSIKRVYSVEGKSPTLTTCQGGHREPKILVNKVSYRKLTPLECERLQTVPDNYTLVPWQKRMMSNTQRYKMLGNGFTVDVIAHILSFILSLSPRL